MTPRCISGFLPPRDKIPKAIPMFSRVSFSTVFMLTRGRPKFRFGFGFGGESGPIYSFGLLSAMAESQIETFGSLSVSAKSELYFRLVAESQLLYSLNAEF